MTRDEITAAALEMRAQGKTWPVIADAFNMSQSTVRHWCERALKPQPRVPPATFWTPRRTEVIRTRWAEHVTASKIAAELGTTKNAVIGKAHRLKLAPRTNAPIGRQAPVVRLPRAHQAHPMPVFKREAAMTPVPAASPRAEPVSRQLRLDELTAFTCRWPTGHPGEQGFGFCGHTSRIGQPYCEEHQAVAYLPRVPVRKRAA